ncbi:F-box/LRR-repeat protein 15-like [Actinia tenebrosa]|uniref:F-box/LRR-repeat protein 15-like n=1 Tax=Actinia tenebrosa TaxID=6105 RepID=A0A6P8I6K3_ACTTE|nr:F-box/LRR-repeat protein 15-like [Actinia tenebrosa]
MVTLCPEVNYISTYQVKNKMADGSTRKTRSVIFFDLPWEDIIFPHIFNTLSLTQISSCRRVCKTFKDLCDSFFKTCKVLDCFEAKDRLTSKAFDFITLENTSLQRLILKDCKNFVREESLIKVLKRNSKLISLYLSGLSCLTNLILFTIGEHCKNLRAISLSECRWVSSDGVVNLSLCCTDLEFIDLTGCWEVTDYCITSLASFCNKLDYISLNGCYSISDNGLRAISRSCPKLVFLGLKGCWRITDDAIRSIGEYCVALEALEVNDCRDVTEASLARLRLKGVEIDVQKPGRRGVPFLPLHNMRLADPAFPHMPVVNLNI